MSHLRQTSLSVFSVAVSIIALCFFVSGSLSAHAAGVPSIVSYQGRLTDSGGNALGGTGTSYYFKFSLWDSPTVGSGSKVWPSSAPGATTLTVKQGYFNVNIGDTINGYPDALTYDFSSNTKVYLQIEVSSDNATYETLSPRSLVTAAPFSQVAGQVSGANDSSFGTTTPLANTLISAISTGINKAVMSIKGIAGQVANLFNIFDSSGNTLFTVAPSGNVGIGTTSPGGKLTIESGNTNYDLSILSSAHFLLNNSDALGQSMLTFAIQGVAKGGIRGDYQGNFNYHAAGPQGFQFMNSLDNSVYAGSISSSGFLVGGSNGDVATNKLEVRGNASIGYTTTAAPSNGLIVNGNVGIGTTTPIGQFAVGSATAGYTGFNLSSGTVNNSIIGPSSATPGNTLFLVQSNGSMGNSGSVFKAQTSGGIGIRITELGNVTLNGSLASFGTGYSPLTVNWNSGSQPTTFNMGSSGAVSGTDLTINSGNSAQTSGNILQIQNGTVPKVTIDYNGYIGIGTTSPSAKFAITGTAGTSDIFAIASSTDARLLTVTSAGDVAIGSKSTNNNYFVTYPTTATRNATGAYGFTFQVRHIITINKLGRYYVAGNSQDHLLKLWNMDTSSLVTSATVLNSSTSDGNNVKYVNITPVTLYPGTTYALMSDETAGGDLYVNQGQYYADPGTTVSSVFSAIRGANASTGALPSITSGVVDYPFNGLTVVFDYYSTESSPSAVSSIGSIGANRLYMANTTSDGGGALYQGGGRVLSTIGRSNTFVGLNSGNFTTTGAQNVAVGNTALSALTSGRFNFGLGSGAGAGITSGDSNIVIGNSAGNSITTTVGNVIIGDASGYTSTGLTSVTYLGQGAGRGVSTFTDAVFLGHNAGGNADGGKQTVTGLTNIIAIGKNSHVGMSNTMVLGGTGSDAVNIVSGTSTPWAKLSIQNTYGSAMSLFDIATTTSSAYATSSVFSVAASGNVGIGTNAPSSQLHTTGTVRFANFGAGTLTTDANGNVSVSSDERLKNIKGFFTTGLSAVENLKPITFNWKPETGLDTENEYTGFSAQNVQSVIPEAVSTDKHGNLTLQDRPILAALVNAVKEVSGSLVRWIAFKNDQLCVDDVCVTKEQFKQMLLNNGGSDQSAPVQSIQQSANIPSEQEASVVETAQIATSTQVTETILDTSTSTSAISGTTTPDTVESKSLDAVVSTTTAQ